MRDPKKPCLFVAPIMLLVGAVGFAAWRSFPTKTAAAEPNGAGSTLAAGTDDSFTFAVVGDSRKGNLLEGLRDRLVNRVRQLIIDKIVESNPALVVHTGDLVRTNPGKKDWQDFEKQIQVFRDKKILYCPVLGNHEYTGNDTGALAGYFECFPALNKQLWYTQTHGHSGLIMLDSNFNKLSREERANQDQWLGDTLRRYQEDRDVAFVFVFFHQPPFTNSSYNKPDAEVQRYFVPLLEKSSKVKFVFSGHVHSYERFKIDGINYVVTGGGGAPLVALLPSANSRYKDAYDTTGQKPRGTHFCLVTVGKDYIELKTLNLDPEKLTWSVGDRYREEYDRGDIKNRGH